MAKLPRNAPIGAPRATRGTSNVTSLAGPRQRAANLELAAAPRAGEAFGAMADTALGFARIEERREGLARDADDTAYADQLSKLMRDAEATRDLADPAEIERIGEEAKQIQADIRGKHKGSALSQRRLDNNLERRRVAFGDTLAASHLAASDAKLKGSFTKRLNALGAQIQKDPQVLLSDNPAAVFRKYAGALEQEISLITNSPVLQRAFMEIGEKQIIAEIMTPMIQAGDEGLQRAKDFLLDPEIVDLVPGETRREMASRVTQAQQKIKEARSKATEYLEIARALSPPGASEAEIRAGARQLAGWKEANNVELFNLGDGRGIAVIDRDSGATRIVAAESPEDAAARAQAVTRAETMGKAEALNYLLQAHGAEPLPVATGTESPEAAEAEKKALQTPAGIAANEPFGVDQPASEDAKAVARLMMSARRMLLIGETGMANGFLSQARIIADNSPEIARAKEMEKPIGNDLAAEIGVPIGTPLGEVGDYIPQTPEQQTESLAIARQRGTQRVAAEQQLSFINEARIVINDLKESVQLDPGIVGARGSLRATGQTVVGVLSDLGLQPIVDAARDIAFDSLDMDESYGLFDNPKLSTIKVTENSLGLILARLRTPQGRVPVDVIQRSINDVKLAGLTSSQQVMNRLDFILGQLDRRAQSLERRFPTTPAGTEGMKRFRIEGESLTPVED